jgi:hypothetical protein
MDQSEVLQIHEPLPAMVGVLVYLMVGTRPGIAFTVSVVSRFASASKPCRHTSQRFSVFSATYRAPSAYASSTKENYPLSSATPTDAEWKRALPISNQTMLAKRLTQASNRSSVIRTYLSNDTKRAACLSVISQWLLATNQWKSYSHHVDWSLQT